jgi:hypothetical protein
LSGEAVSLQARLTLFFVAIVVLPVAVATAYGWQAVARSSQRRSRPSCAAGRQMVMSIQPLTRDPRERVRLLAIVLLGLVVGELARAFERMGVELGEYLTAVRSSRDELACSMNRLGETLSSTHDLPKLLAVVLEAAVQARRAKAGSLLLLTADRTALVREATHGRADPGRPGRRRDGRGHRPASRSPWPTPRPSTRPSSRAGTGWSPPGTGCCR